MCVAFIFWMCYYRRMKKLIFASFVFCAAVLSCQSSQIALPASLTAEQMIQMGQDAYNDADYSNAVRCYQEVMKRFADNPSNYTEACYELGRIALRQKHYGRAYDYFQMVIDLYDAAQIGTVPAAFKKLAILSISQIPEGRIPATRR